uniref:Uncharacterized protein MANES_09G008100 n=1 Tax=Rhizophora mucronata TaxID=61149 RepID=A0A2P2P639_RHIMU
MKRQCITISPNRAAPTHFFFCLSQVLPRGDRVIHKETMHNLTSAWTYLRQAEKRARAALLGLAVMHRSSFYQPFELFGLSSGKKKNEVISTLSKFSAPLSSRNNSIH